MKKVRCTVVLLFLAMAAGLCLPAAAVNGMDERTMCMERVGVVLLGDQLAALMTVVGLLDRDPVKQGYCLGGEKPVTEDFYVGMERACTPL